MGNQRLIGPVGTIARVVVGGGLLVVAAWGVDWYEPLLGLVGFPAFALIAQMLRTRFTTERLEASGGLGFWINCGITVALFAIPFTRVPAALFYGASILVASARGYTGCEVLAISNWLLKRDDQVGCLLFSPIDALEKRRGDARRTRSRQHYRT